MNAETKGSLFVGFICCVWPSIVAAIAIIMDRRYREGGWKAIFPGKEKEKE